MAESIQFSSERQKDKVMLNKLNVVAPRKYLNPTQLARQLLNESLDRLIPELGLTINDVSAQSADAG